MSRVTALTVKVEASFGWTTPTGNGGKEWKSASMELGRTIELDAHEDPEQVMTDQIEELRTKVGREIRKALKLEKGMDPSDIPEATHVIEGVRANAESSTATGRSG